MKKITIIVVSLLLTLFSYAQDFNRISRATKLEFRDSKWNLVETRYPTDLFVIMKDWDISIGTFKLKTYDAPEKTIYQDHTTFTWKCIDKDGDRCYFMIKKFRPEITSHLVYSIVYEQFLLMYEYETE